MQKIKKEKNTFHEKGQALLFVVVAVTIALAVGVSVSTRNLNMASRISRTDTSSRVLVAAEGGAERLLVQPVSFLEGLKGSGEADCGDIGTSDGAGRCIITFEKSAGDNITSRAIVDVEDFTKNAEDHYWFNLEPGRVKEINLEGYGFGSVEVCWDSVDTAIYYISYDKDGNIKRGGLKPSGFSSDSKVDGKIDGKDAFVTADATESHGTSLYCSSISLVSNAYGLRLKALYSNTQARVYGNLPPQGYKIISIGELLQENDVRETKTIHVYKSYSYMPSMFDYAIYTSGSIN